MTPLHRVLVPALLLGFLLMPASASAEDCDPYLSYSELKSTGGGLVQDAIGALPDSSLNGTFNRFSALFQRGTVRDLCVGDDDLLPPNFVAGRDLAVADLLVDVQEAIDAFATGAADCGGDGEIDCADAKFVLLQLVAHVVVERHVDLYSDEFQYSCDCSHCTPTTDPEWCKPQGLRDLAVVVDLLTQAGWFDHVNARMTELAIGGTQVDPPLTGDTFGLPAFRDAVVQNVERAVGEPWIDYGRVTGVESIDYE